MINLYLSENQEDNIIFLLEKHQVNDIEILSQKDKDRVINLVEKKVSKFIFVKDSGLVILSVFEKTDGTPENLEKARKAAFGISNDINEWKLQVVSIVNLTDAPELTLAFAEGLLLSNYQFLNYYSNKDEKINALTDVSIVDKKINPTEIEELKNLAQAVYVARDLVNEPVSTLNAVELSKWAERTGEESGYSVHVLHKDDIVKEKMGGLLAVNRGSIDPPTFSILEWKPANRKNEKPIVVVGKGVVYDTGGLSLKPTPDSMDYMKSDMAGAAAVVGILSSVAKSKLPVHVIGLIPATDNRPDGNAYAPGDVITMHSGKTVEVMNTDAEGRLILADALSYA